MKIVRFLGFLLCLLGSPFAGSAQSFQWTNSIYNTPGATLYDVASPTAIATDQAGNVYSAGWIRGTVDVDGTILTTTGNPGMGDGLLVKYTPSGSVAWVKQCINAVYLTDVKTDATGNVYALGFYVDHVQVDNITLTCGLNNKDYFIAKWTSAGNLLWAVNGGSTGARYPEKLAIDPAGNVVIVGAYRDVTAFGSIVLTPTYPASVKTSGFIAKYTASGAILWAHGFINQDTLTTTRCSSVGIDQTGTIYLTGIVHGTATTGNCSLTSTPGLTDFFWARFDASGQCLKTFQVQPNYYYNDFQIAVDPVGYTYLSAPFAGTVDLGGITLVSGNPVTVPAQEESFVARYDPNGILQWAKQISGDHTDAISLALDQEKLYVSGSFRSPATSGSVTVTTTGAFDAFVMAFEKHTGTSVWGRSGGGVSADAASTIAANNSGLVVFAGQTNGPVTFGTTTTGSQASPANGYWFTSKILQETNSIKGTVFIDNNGNGTQDVNEAGYQNGAIVQATPGPLQFAAATTGAYEAVVEQGNYTLSLPQPVPYYTITPPAQPVVSFSSFGNMVSGKDFALQPIPSQQDVQVLITPLQGARPGYTTSYRITYRNIGTTIIPSGSVTLNYTSPLVYLSSTQPGTVNGSVITWNYTGLQPGQTRNFNVLFNLPTTAVVGQLIAATADITPLTGDLGPADNTDASVRLITGSYDPNSLVVDYAQLTQPQVQGGQWLTYTIHFQNLGTDTAFTVMLRDSLPLTELNLSSLQFLSASGNCTWQLSQAGVLTVNFTDIRLPYANINVVSSNGYVRFRVKPMPTLAPGMVIQNRASIYFDFNTPEVTNNATTQINGLSAVTGEESMLPLTIWPNPASALLHLNIGLPTPDKVNVHLLNATGKQVLWKALAASEDYNHHLDLSGLAKGLYLLEIQSGDLRSTRKIILE